MGPHGKTTSGNSSTSEGYRDPLELPWLTCCGHAAALSHISGVSVLQAISIVGDEVFSFTMSLTPNATEGPGYADTSRTDGTVKLNVGCVQVVYLHKFIMSLLVSVTTGFT